MSNTEPQWVGMGYIKGVFGVKGWVKVAVSTEYTDSLLDYPQWRLSKDGHSRMFTVAESKVAGDELQVLFSGIDNRDAAFALRGHTVEIDRADFGDTEDGEYYWADLIGLNVVNRQQQCLGTVSKLLETGAHDVLVVDGEFGQKLIPFVAQYIDEVILAEQTIRVDWGTDY
ncbi:ribosome maturation factor RimM [Paralysiella testudinis]|uniref:Ribosome maturation factor RimM n=1 Tax=Paralysiella testudinis TaxID=2809020 RepID=A0A892ZLA3_9NEIS|nr:ribosome maturation factor RimM [Paralysiella testudinis]QRQ83188.1 ribosome maturation factor RimM [Paralysiella testudinis]